MNQVQQNVFEKKIPLLFASFFEDNKSVHSSSDHQTLDPSVRLREATPPPG